MDLRRLRAALAVAEHGHFGRAAAASGLTQSALSQSVKALEADLGVALFDRTTRRVEVTTVGAELLAEAARAVSILDTAADRVRAAGRGEAGQLVVGLVGSALVPPVPEILRAQGRLRPSVSLEVVELPTSDQLQRLAAGTLDVGFVRPPLPAPHDEDLRLVTVAREALVAVLPRRHRLARNEYVRVRDLAGEPFVRTPRSLGPGLHDEITALCRQAGFEPTTAQEAVALGSVVGLVAAGFGVAVLPESAASAPHRAVRFVPLRPRRTIDLAVAVRRQGALPQASAFVALAADVTRAPAKDPPTGRAGSRRSARGR